IVFVPLVAGMKSRPERGENVRSAHGSQAYVPRALFWASLISLIIVDLIPGSLPRYTMPLLAPFAWVLASILTAETVAWPRWLGGKPFSLKDRRRAIALLGGAPWGAGWIYALAIVPGL